MAKKRILNRFDPSTSIPILNKMIYELEQKVEKLQVKGGAVITRLSQLTNDVGFVADPNYTHTDNNYTDTDKTKVANAVNSDDLSSVATSGDYDDLSNTPEPYTLPKASANTLGGIKVGSGLSVGTDGTLSASGGGLADSVEWSNVQNKPNFSAVATSGSFDDLADKPDYIVEKGEDANWMWEKWNSGKAVAWSKVNVSSGTLTMNQSSYGYYYSNPVTLNLPKIFINETSTQESTELYSDQGHNFVKIATNQGVTSNTIKYRVVKLQSNTATVSFKVMIIHRWK